MITGNDLRAGMRVLDSDGDFIGTITGISANDVRVRRDGVVDGEHDVPLTRFSRTDGESVFLDGPWATILTTLGGIAAGVGATTARAADNVGDRVRDAVTPDHTVRTTSYDRDAYVEPERKTNIWPWLLLGAAAIAAFLAMRSCNTAEVPAPVDPVVETSMPATPAGSTDGTVDWAVAPKEGTITIPAGAGVTSELRDTKPVVKVYFDTAKTDVAPAFAGAATGLKTYLDANSASTLAVSGFNDPRGNAAANAELSKNRAEAVKVALEKAGVPAAKIELVKPEASTDTKVDEAGARRVEVVVR